MHWAAYKGNLDVVKFLLEQPLIEPDLVTRGGQDVFEVATVGRNRETIDWLRNNLDRP